MAKMQNIPKSLWEATAMKKHPEILELRERIRPLSKLSSYAKNVASGHFVCRSLADTCCSQNGSQNCRVSPSCAAVDHGIFRS
jgi:hypothetical protein